MTDHINLYNHKYDYLHHSKKEIVNINTKKNVRK